MGVKVVDARAAKTGVPLAATCTAAKASARTADAIFCLIVENNKKKRGQLSATRVAVLTNVENRRRWFSLVGR